MNAFSFTFRTIASILLMVVVFFIIQHSFVYETPNSPPVNNILLFAAVMFGMWVYVVRARLKIKGGDSSGNEYALVTLLIGIICIYFPVKAVYNMFLQNTFNNTEFFQWVKIAVCMLMVIFTMPVMKLIEEKNRSFMEDFTSFHWIEAVKDLGKGASRMAYSLYAFAATAFIVLSIFSTIWLYRSFGLTGLIVESLIFFLILAYIAFAVIHKTINLGKEAANTLKSKKTD
jgi:hypothetical protein